MQINILTSAVSRTHRNQQELVNNGINQAYKVPLLTGWLQTFCVNYSSAKTEFLLLDFKPQLNKTHNPALVLNNAHPVHPSAYVRNCGFVFDSHLTFSDQISSVSLACFYHIRDLGPVHPALDVDTPHTIGKSFVRSRLDCSSLPKSHLDRIRLTQNVLARAFIAAPMVLPSRPYSQISALVQDTEMH